MIPSFEEFKKNKSKGSDSTIKTQGNVQRKSTFPSFDEFKKINSSGQSNSPDYASINRRLEATQRQQQQEKIYSEPVDKLQNEHKKNVGDFYAGFKTGVQSLKQLASGAIAVTGEAIGSEKIKEYGLSKYKKFENASIPYQDGRVTNLESIHSLGNAVDWAQYNIGNVAPSVIESIGSAVIGSLAGSAVATPGVGTAVGGVSGFFAKNATKKFLQKQVGKMVSKGIAADIAKKEAEKNLVKRVGSGIALFGNSYVQGLGDNYGEVMDTDSKNKVTTSFIGALPYAALDTLAEITILGKVLKGSTGASAIRRFTGAIASGSIIEGAQEATQEGELIIAGLLNGVEYTTKDVLSRLANSFAAAGLAGGLSGVLSGRKSSETNDENIKTQLNQDSNPSATTPTQTTPPPPPPAAPQSVPVNPIDQEIQQETQDNPNTKVPELFSALESGDEAKIASTIDSMSKTDLEAAKNVLEVAKSDERYTKDMPKEDVAKIDRHLEMINDLIDDKNIAIAKKADEIISGGVTTQEIADLHPDDIPQAKKVVEVIKEKLDTKKSELLKEKAAVSSDVVAKKQIQEKINQVDESRHAIENGLKKTEESTESANDIVNEAKKYDTAEEFVKAHGTPVYHGSPAGKLDMIKSDSGVVYVTREKSTAGQYKYSRNVDDKGLLSERDGLINHYQLTDDTSVLPRIDEIDRELSNIVKSGRSGGVTEGSVSGKVLNIIKDKKSLQDAFNKMIVDDLSDVEKRYVSNVRENGVSLFEPTLFDKSPGIRKKLFEQGISGIEYPHGILPYSGGKEGTQIALTHESAIKTKSQLNDIWKEAHKNKELTKEGVVDDVISKREETLPKEDDVLRKSARELQSSFNQAINSGDMDKAAKIRPRLRAILDEMKNRKLEMIVEKTKKEFTDGMDPMVAGKANATLDKKTLVDGQTTTKRKFIENLASEEGSSAVIEKKTLKSGEKADSMRIYDKDETFFEVSKTEFDYFNYLKNGNSNASKNFVSNLKGGETVSYKNNNGEVITGKVMSVTFDNKKGTTLGISEDGNPKNTVLNIPEDSIITEDLTETNKNASVKSYQQKPYETVDTNSRGGLDSGKLPGDVSVGTSESEGTGKSDKVDDGKGQLERGKQSDNAGERTSDGRKLSKKEIEDLVNSKDSFTDAEKEILKQYEGSGGQKEGSGRGVLDEYYTPQAIVDKMWDLVKSNISIPVNNVLEPSSGVGRFFDGAKGAQIDAFETNPVSAKIAQTLYPKANVTNGSFESIFIDEKGKKKSFEPKYDVVIGNPPYGAHRGKYKGLGEEQKISRYEEYFIKRSLDLTNEGGIVAMIVPSGFLRGGESYSKKEIAKIGKLIDAYRMPNGSFGTTDIGTDILVFKKNTFNKETERIETRVAMISDDMYFQEIPSRVLGIEGERKGRFGMEKAVKGTLDEAIQKIQIELDIAQDIVEHTPAIEFEQPMTEKVVSKAKDKSRKALFRETKAKKSGKDTGIAGLFKRSKETPHIVESIKKAKLKSFTQGNITETESKFIKNTEEDGSISGDISNEDKALLNYAGGKYFNDFNYYQGDIREKIAQLESDKKSISQEQYDRQKSGLEAILPKEVSIDRITILPISTLAKQTRLANGETMIDSFSKYLSDLPYAAFEGSNKWEIAGYINGNPVSGSDKASNAKIRVRRRKVGNKLFKKFYNEELEVSDKKIIEDAYNKTYNNYHKPDYTKFQLKIEMYDKFYGKDFNLKEIQMEGAAFLVNKGVGILAYEVGVGKTLSGIAAITGVMQKGWAKKPLIIVPKNLKSKWIKDMAESMPNIKINDLDNLGGGFKYNGDRSQLSIEEGSISIITEEGFKRIGFKDETYTRLTDGLEDVMYEKDAKKNKRSQEIEKANTEQIVGKAMKNTDFPVSFEDLGFDHITIDEAHRAKSVFSKAKAKGKGKSSNEYGAVRGSVSERGLKTYLATQYILEQNKGRNVFLLTATPFNNSPIEIYSMLSLVAKARFEQLGIKNINDFISLFVDLETKYAIKANGTAVQTDQVRNFQNLQQLQALVREYIDFRTGDEAGIQRPKKEKKTPSLKMTALQSDLIQKAQELFSPALRKEGGTLRAITELQKITLSPYLSQYSDKSINQVSPEKLVEDSPKIKYTIEAIKKVHSVNKNVGQIIYAEKGIEVFEPIRQHFIKNLGYKASEVAIIDSSLSADAKDLAQQRFQNGEIRVLLASGTVKEGIDLQKNSTDIYNLWLPWNPTDMIQAEGRTWRQGSLYDNVRVHYPLIQNSIDPFIFQKLDEKASRLSSVFSYKGDTLDVSDIDFEGMKFDLITDPTLKVQAQFDYKEAELKDSLTVAEAELAFIERRTQKIKVLEEEIKENEKYIARLDPQTNEHAFKYYTDKIIKDKAEVKEERLKLEKRGIDVSEIEKKSLAKKEEISKAKDSIEKLNEQLGKDLAIAKEAHLGNMGGVNDYNAILKDMTDKSFFTVSGKEYTGKFNEDIKLPSLSRIDELHGMSDSQLLNSYELRAAKSIVEEFKTKEMTPEYADQIVFDITQKILMPDESGNTTADAYYKKSTVYANLAGKSREVAFGLLRHELTHDINHLLRGTKHDTILLDWYRGMSEIDVIKLFKIDKNDTIQERTERYKQYSEYLKEKTKSFEEYEYFMANEAAAHARQFYSSAGTNLDKTFYENLKSIIRRIISLILRNSEYRYNRLMKSYDRFFNPKGSITINKSARAQYDKARESLNERIFEVTKGDFNRYKEAIASLSSSKNEPTMLAIAEKKDLVTPKGKVSIADLYRKVYADLYETKAPPLNSLSEEKIIRGMTKRSFTLGKRYATKITKENYKKVNTEIRDYIVKNIKNVEKRGSLVRAIISAKNANDTKIIIKRVDDIVDYQKALSAAKKLVIDTIETRKLLKTDNLRKAMKLPLIHNMNLEQLEQYFEALDKTEVGDEFLTQRMIETVRFTELKGITTVKGVRKILDKKLGDNFAKRGIKISPLLDRVRWDTALAESNEFMHLLVQEKDMAFLQADAKTLIAEEEINKLAKASRRSKERTLLEKIVPEDEAVFKYLESSDKPTLAKDMTTEQLALASYLETEFEKMRDYLIQNEQLKKYRENYITHIRKDFIEKWKSNGLYTAIKTIFEQQQVDEASFEILSGETEEIIPFEKWFQFAMRRSGAIDPSKNVMKAFLAYKLSFERKVALDSLIPKIMTYVHSLTPSKTTDRGLVMDRRLKKFVTSWLNSKKGRKFDFGGFLRQGSVADSLLLGLRSFTSVIDLGLSIPIGVASNVGEQSSNFIFLGSKQYLKGVARAQTSRGQKFLAKYENFVGKTPWKSISSGATHIGDKIMGGLFYLFHSSQVRANKHFLLGAITDEEYANGEVSIERLAQMKIDMGRWRVVEGTKSIVGNTSVGGVASQYKTWAVVILRTSAKNIETVVKTRDFSSREAQETIRQALLLSTVGFITLMTFGGDDEDKSFLSVLYQKIVRDALSSLSALDPTLYIASPRSLTFLIDLSSSIKSILKLEEYKTSKEGSYQEGDLKGVNKLERTVTPSVIKQLQN